MSPYLFASTGRDELVMARPRSTTLQRLRLIGVDWAASDEAKRGLALAELDARGDLTLLEVGSGTRERRATERIAAWLSPEQAPGEVVVGIDAPLGWPRVFAAGIATHRAGESLGAQTHAAEFFDRVADRHVHRVYGKKPLEVGADRIARTAFSALALVAELRRHRPLAMGWAPPTKGEAVVIEVYPAATLRTLVGGRTPPYKKIEQVAARTALAAVLAEHVTMSSKQRALAVSSDHLLDAIACTVAAADFVTGRAQGPTPELADLARQEGWIWIRG